MSEHHHHDCHCNHEHHSHFGHTHNHTVDAKLQGIFYICIALNLIYVIVESGMGWLYGSLSLLSDAGHNLGDVFSLVIALFAFKIATRAKTKRFTYGYKRATVLASLLNSVLLLTAVGAIIVESLHKFNNPTPIDGTVVSITAGVGILINGITTLLLMSRQSTDLNVKGAFLHMAMDTLVSMGVVLSGIIIHYTGLYYIDTIISLVIAFLIIASTWGLLRESVVLTLDGVPHNVDIEHVESAIKSVDGVRELHHLHVWALSTTQNAATVHVLIQQTERIDEIVHSVKEKLEELNITHATVECETKSCAEHCNVC